MTQRTRILFGIGVAIALVAVMLGMDVLRRASGSPLAAAGEATLAPGSIPIYVGGKLVGGFQPADLDRLETVSFIDPAEGKVQEGWLLRDVLLLHIGLGQLKPDSRITVHTSSRGKSVVVTWAEADEDSNRVMFDLTNRGTLKLVAAMGKLSARDQWVQDVDKIEVETMPRPSNSET